MFPHTLGFGYLPNCTQNHMTVIGNVMWGVFLMTLGVGLGVLGIFMVFIGLAVGIVASILGVGVSYVGLVIGRYGFRFIRHRHLPTKLDDLSL